MFADELASAMSTEILLFTIAFFPVFGYIKAPATGTRDCYGDLHDP
jgi:hypothetical protein